MQYKCDSGGQLAKGRCRSKMPTHQRMNSNTVQNCFSILPPSRGRLFGWLQQSGGTTKWLALQRRATFWQVNFWNGKLHECHSVPPIIFFGVSSVRGGECAVCAHNISIFFLSLYIYLSMFPFICCGAWFLNSFCTQAPHHREVVLFMARCVSSASVLLLKL